MMILIRLQWKVLYNVNGVLCKIDERQDLTEWNSIWYICYDDPNSSAMEDTMSMVAVAVLHTG
jgi:hypothetical protein